MLPMLLPFAPPPPPALRLSVAASGLSEFCPLSPAVDPLSGLLSPCLFDSARAVTTLVAAVVLFALSVTAATTAAGHSSPAVTAGRSILQRLGWRRDGGPGGSADDSNEATEPLLAGLGVAEAAGSPPAQRSSGYSAMAVFLRLDLAVAAIAAVTSALCLVLDTIQVATQPDARPSPLPQRHRVPARIVDDSAMALAWALIAVSIALPAMHRRTSLASNRALVATWAMAAAFAAVDLRQWNIALAGLPGGGGEGRPHDPSDAIFATASLLSSACVAAGGVATLLFGPTFGAALSSPDAPTPSTARDLETGAAVDQPTAAGAADAVPTEKPVSAWTNALRNLRRLLPFLRPHGLRYQLFLAATFLVLALGRVVNVVMPIQYKHVVDALGSVPEENRSPYYAWGAVLLFSFLRYLQGGGSGVLGTMQTLLWTPVMLANTRKISVDMLTHLHCLSLQFHINRKTGEVLRVMDRGTNSIGSLLSSLLLQLGPMVLDIVLAIASFTVLFDGLTAMVVFVTMVLYIIVTILITEWRTKFRREMNRFDSALRAKAVDSLLNFETVKYYTNEAYEVSRYDKACVAYQGAEWISTTSLALLNTAQNTVITLGMTAGCLLCATRVTAGSLTVGDFIMFVTYILQLYRPLNFFGTYYRMIQQNFIDMESMFELFEQGAAVADAPDASALLIKDGTIEFDNVSFGYDSRSTAIENLSFTVPAKSTVALVGPSGSGKSTVFRLLFRFYDPQSGRILVDGQDVKQVKLHSLRRNIGVVPQDTVCFNDTIAYNIGYGDVEKSFEDVCDAARKAQIHDRIMTFPDKYDTKVGERGLRLSGGEKQRVAIARTLLKDPKIVLLDEATSALDNTTEARIQRSLLELTSRRTTLVIAHRLSTVVAADCILVLRNGHIVEQGTHQDLLAAGERVAAEKKRLRSTIAAAATAADEVTADLASTKTDAAAPAIPINAASAAAAAAAAREELAHIEETGVGTYYTMWMRELEDDANAAAAEAAGITKDAAQVVPLRRPNKGAVAGNATVPDAGFHGMGGGGGFH